MRLLTAILAALLTFSISCDRRDEPKPKWVLLRSDRTVGKSAYPLAMDAERVGTYPAVTKNGGGYFYDNVLEYRVWLHPENGAPPWNGDSDYYVAFAQFEPAAKYAAENTGAEKPLVLVRQLEWLDEPEPGHYIPKKGERITEWSVKWLDAKRTETSIHDFLAHPRPIREETGNAE